jgi:hypothetical protein
MRFIGYIKRKVQERRAKKQQETPTEKAARRTAVATVWIAFFTFVSIAVSGGTLWVLKRQLTEIRGTGSDTHTLAQAANTQAQKMSDMSTAADKIRQAAENMVTEDQRIADNAKESLDASNRQSNTALDASIMASRDDQRAWVAQVGMGFDAPEVGKVLKGFVTWNNSGKTFAKRVVPRVHFGFVPVVIPDENTLMKLAESDILGPSSIGVLAPNGQYKTSLETKTPIEDIDKERINGTWYTYIWGEMTYDDIFGRTHTITFCSSRQGTSGDFVQCPFHNDAN